MYTQSVSLVRQRWAVECQSLSVTDWHALESQPKANSSQWFCQWQTQTVKVAHYYLDFSIIVSHPFLTKNLFSQLLLIVYKSSMQSPSVFILFFYLQDAEMLPLKFFAFSVIIWLISEFLSFTLLPITTVMADILNILDQVLSYLHVISFNPHENPKNIYLIEPILEMGTLRFGKSK